MAGFDLDGYVKKNKAGGFDLDAYVAKANAPKDPESNLPGAAQAGLESFGNTATLGYLPQLQALASKAMPNPTADLDEELRAQGFKISQQPSTYLGERDANLARQQMQQEQHPVASGVGTALGIAATALVPGGAIAKGAGYGQKVWQGAKIGGLMGAAANPGDVQGEFSPVQLAERIEGGAKGALFGGVLSGAVDDAQVVFERGAKAFGNKAALKAARAVGRPTPTQAKEMARTGQDVALGRTLLDEGAVPILGTPGRIAKRVEKLKEKTWGAVEDLLNKGGDDAVVDGAEAGMRILNSEELTLLREAGETGAVQALEDAAEQLAGMGKVTLPKAQQIKRTIDKQINYNKAIPDMTGGQAARFAKRTALRDQMDDAVTGLGGAKNELKGAFRKHGLLEKASEIGEKEAGRQQANRAISLTDTVAAAGALSSGGGPLLSLAAGAINKAGRTFGNSVQARGFDAASKLMAKSPAMTAYAQRNPIMFQVLINRMNSPEPFKEGLDPILQDEQILGIFRNDPSLIDQVRDPKLKSRLQQMFQREPASGRR